MDANATMDTVSLGQRIGAMKGKLFIPDDFDAPLPDDVLATFERKNHMAAGSGYPVKTTTAKSTRHSRR